MSGASSPPPLFDSFNVASKACLTGGYEYKKLVDVVVRKNKILQDATSSSVEFDFSAMRIIMAVGLASNKQEKISVLDFGGGGGYHWFIAKNSFGKNTIFDWRIVETSMMAKVSTELLAKDGLEFFSDIKSSLRTGETLDLVFTSSALQYCEEPLKVLQNLVNLNARYLFITRTPFSLAPTPLISNQRSMLSENGPGPMPEEFEDELIEYPISYIPKKEVERIIQEKYEIRFSLKEEPANLFFGDVPVNNYYGFFCELK
jgi:hypothetical protein